MSKTGNISAALITSALFLSTTSLAFAHVVINPKQAIPGRQDYYVRVPTEKDSPTVELRLVVPQGMTITGIQNMPGWKHSEKTAPAPKLSGGDDDDAPSDMITEIDWTGGSISPGEYGLFGFSTNYTGNPASFIWKAYQKYSTGEMVAWDDTNPANPAPKVTIAAAGNTPAPQSPVQAVTQMAPSPGSSGNMLSILALVISLIALLISIFGHKLFKKTPNTPV